MQASQVYCPHCGAPLPLQWAQRIVLCAYCNTSARVTISGDPAAPGPLQITADDVPKSVVEQVKQLVVAGRHGEAVALYAQHARVTPADADAAVKQLVTPLLFRLTRQMPLRAAAVPIFLLVIGAAVAAAAFGVQQAIAGEPAYLLLTLLCGLFAVWNVLHLAPKFVSMLVLSFGAEGQARIVKAVTIRQGYVKGGTLMLVLMDVAPLAGGVPPFREEEALLVRDESVHKLAPGNIIRVRFDQGRDRRVFPVSPIEVVGRG